MPRVATEVGSESFRLKDTEEAREAKLNLSRLCWRRPAN